jgi:hypothetical protein
LTSSESGVACANPLAQIATTTVSKYSLFTIQTSIRRPARTLTDEQQQAIQRDIDKQRDELKRGIVRPTSLGPYGRSAQLADGYTPRTEDTGGERD